MDPTLRESLERERRARLHRQIGALQAALEEIGHPLTRWEREWCAKLKNNIVALERQLAQPMLLPPAPRQNVRVPGRSPGSGGSEGAA